MPRPKMPRFIKFNPEVVYFKPRGVPLRNLEEVVLLPEEIEALKLYEVDSLDQTNAAKRMKISQPTFARIIASAHKKTAKAIIEGCAIRIQSTPNNT